MDITAVEKSYARWAPVYDHTFGRITAMARRRTVNHILQHGGNVLEVGVGTGLALPLYDDRVAVTGIDYSADMLGKARKRVRQDGLTHVRELRQMDARDLDFPDNHFDTVAAMHVLSVVPEPERVMQEIARVCKPGGQVVIANHFQRETGVMARIERLFAPLENQLGWHSDFPLSTVLSDPRLSVVVQKSLPPLGLMTFLVLQKAHD
ncbi:class I SAM-dependent methyltransferase [Loktanella sp. M215]|uniref:class I SAM-dependent methyltransferase n=1 Tax=Loktanella sp. M215 TaxID=2675431 RepID=UPI001F253B59|nr:class I SAM-dependent methyltransferase [Loktanella sp. M215]MCF7700625.1 methyltransferase domain-containing protein [Loktanella sp. M215]